MKINDDLYALPLAVTMARGPSTLFLSLIPDPDEGATLVDACIPGKLETIERALSEAGVRLADVGRVILTHHDLDHIGSLADVVAASHAQVLAHEAEVPYIDGRRPPQKSRTPEQMKAMLAQMPPEMQRMLTTPVKPVEVDTALHDGDRLDLGGGVLVVATPGHTVGHASLYLERSRTIIAGDALTAADGRLAGPSVQATADMVTARASVVRLAELEVRAIVCYHGGLVTDDAGGQLRRLAAELGAG